MLTIKGYENLQKLGEQGGQVIYSALREQDKKAVVLKALHPHPSSDDIAFFYHEYDISKNLKLEEIIQTYEVIDHGDQYVLVQEDMQGIPLSEYLKKKPLNNLTDFFKLAVGMSRILISLHQNHIIHKDIRPSNFIINPKQFIIKITAFNFASQLLHEIQDIVPPSKLEGSLAYMAPEQTGRMNMNIDYRADFYALGVSFYEMLAGKLPFQSLDPLELLHAHLVSPISEISTASFEIPSILMAIIAKLMAKNPIDRYQSAGGLFADLERCQSELEKTGKIDDFILGQQDVFDHLNLSQKLYGREKEAKVLLETYERSSRGNVEILMVCGYSGIGKTMLINEVHKPMLGNKGYFIKGKFDQLLRNTPYTALQQAFNQLARLILAEPENRFEAIKTAILKALGSSGQIIIELAPDMELVIGPQAPLEKLPPQETQNRMMIYFRQFLQAVASADHPLVIFIDDLQWIDSGSLRLLELLVKDNLLQYVFFIGAYRDNEIEKHHPLQIFFDESQRQQRKINFLRLAPLSVDDFSALLVDSFHQESKTTQALAELIHKRTEGNPFFCKQVINTIYQEKLLHFDYKLGRWEWDLAGISDLKITDNVVDLMLSKLKKLPLETQKLLQYAACIGNRFSVKMLALISGKSLASIGKALWPALQEELLLTLRLGYKRMEAMSHEVFVTQQKEDVTYQFIHDRIQQAAYESIPVEERQKTQLTIARTLMEKDPEGCKNERLFEVTDHFNDALSLLEGSEKTEVAKLNYLAGKKAENANAYQPMNNYFANGLSLIDESGWDNDVGFTFNLNKEYALSLFLLKKQEEALSLIKKLQENFRSSKEKDILYRLKLLRLEMLIYNSQGEIDKLFETGQIALKLLGIHFKADAKKIYVWIKFFRVVWYLIPYRKKRLDAELPMLTDPNILEAFEILNTLNFPCTLKNGTVISEIAFIGMELMLRYGKPRSAGLWAVTYSIAMIRFFRNVDRAFYYWDMAERFVREFPDKFFSSMTYNQAGFQLIHWRYHESQSEPYYIRGIVEATEAGNILSASQAQSDMAAIHEFSLMKSLEDTISHLKMDEKVSADLFTDWPELRENSIILLENLAVGEHTRGNRLDEIQKILEEQKEGTMAMFTFALRVRSFYFYFMESYPLAIQYYESWLPQDEAGRYDAFSPESYTVAALALLKELPSRGGFKRWRQLGKIKKLIRFLKWTAKTCPINYLHHYYFVRAMQLKLKGKIRKALKLFDQAIENAKRGEYLLWVGLGNELAGEMLVEDGQQRSAKDYLMEAHYYYQRYGITAKTKSLVKRYPSCLQGERYDDEAASKTNLAFQSTLTVTKTTSAELDFMSAIKASQAISSEIILDKLFEKMLHIVLESAGAVRALFLEREKNQWVVTAELKLEATEEIFSLIKKPLSEFPELPHSVIQYVTRSQESVVLNNASESSQYRLDPYIVRTNPKSIICLPILQHNRIIGVIYLENNLVIGAFTQARVIGLTTLSSQIGISLENSHYIDRMQKLHQKTERFVPKRFLELLKKENIEEVELGDHMQMNVTAMFSDIRNFTSLSEQLGVERLSTLLNIYLGYMAPIIREHHGFVEHFLGDGILALFPQTCDDAVKAALQMQEKFSAFNENIKSQGLMPIEMGIGLNYGTAMLSILGEAERLDANVISDAINLTARIESLNKYYKTELLISGNVYQQLLNKEGYLIRLLDKVKVKGKSKGINIYEVRMKPLDVNLLRIENDYINRFEVAFKAYEKGEFHRAEKLFLACISEKPDDHVAQLFAARCKEFQTRGTPPNWDGTYTALTK